MLEQGWDDDLKAFVMSWRVANEWLNAAEEVHPDRWHNIDHVHLQQLSGNRLANLPNELSRGDIFGVAQGSDADPLTAFLWTMAWGHNGNNYGASRADKIAADSNAAEKITQIVALTQQGSIEAAFDGLHGQYRLIGLGTSFVSKLIYFAGFDPDPDSTQPLIFDSFIANALAEVIDPALAQTSWNYQTRSWAEYWVYCDLVRMIRNRYVPNARIDMVEDWLWLIGGGWCWHRAAIRRNRKYPLP